MGETPRILIIEPDRFSARALDILRGVGEVDLREVPDQEVPQAFADADVVWLRLARSITAGRIGPRPRCRILATATTGLDHIDLEACRERGIRVVSLRGQTEFLRDVRATAELTVALALALLRHIPAAAASVRRGEWCRDRFRGRELHGKTAGLVGVGRLGSIVAPYFRAFGMRVLGYDPRPDFPDAVAERVPSLAELLERGDVVSVHAAYGPGTHHLIGAPQLARMPPGAILVNTARGPILDEAAVLEALRQGRLSGAALDVLTGEPDVDGSHPVVQALDDLPNLLVVPHLGGNTYESIEKTEVFLAGQVADLLRSPAS